MKLGILKKGSKWVKCFPASEKTYAKTQRINHVEKKKFLVMSDVDVVEEALWEYDAPLLRHLLEDKTTKKSILWATKDYESRGEDYGEFCEIKPELITGENTLLIQPRSTKPKEEQIARTRDKAEVFTPSWVCNCQNNLIDVEWFKNTDAFNTEINEGWITKEEPIDFSATEKSWMQYVDAQRLEITCGEAPYLVSRYDTVTGTPIPVRERIGLLDRKMRVVDENTKTYKDWTKWSIRAFQSVYGFDFQGDNVLLARENLLLSYIDYYRERNHENPQIVLLRAVTNIIAWNIWQMDGLKYVVPNSCHEISGGYDLSGEPINMEPCPGCQNEMPFSHNGIYCVVKDWRSKSTVRFVDMMRRWG